ncbi:MAG: hypothetical protein IJJ11_04315, partial [Methanosphaera sp.]|nr:hypothetical protein [Methanosphaera sp.]
MKRHIYYKTRKSNTNKQNSTHGISSQNLHYRHNRKIICNKRIPINQERKNNSYIDISNIDYNRTDDLPAHSGCNLTVLELVEKYIATKINVREPTRAGYNTVINLLKKETFGNERIDNVRISDAKLWFIKLQREDGKGYSSIHSIRGVLKPAFQLAVDDDYLGK